MYKCFGGVRFLFLHGSSLFLDYPKMDPASFSQGTGNNTPIHAASYTTASKSAFRSTHPFHRGTPGGKFCEVKVTRARK